VDEGYGCADDGLVCTQDVCNGGVCTHPILPPTPSGAVINYCLVDDTCHKEGDGTSCAICEPWTTQTSFTPQPDNTSCPADLYSCTVDTCQDGVCTHELEKPLCAGAGDHCIVGKVTFDNVLSPYADPSSPGVLDDLYGQTYDFALSFDAIYVGGVSYCSFTMGGFCGLYITQSDYLLTDVELRFSDDAPEGLSLFNQFHASHSMQVEHTLPVGPAMLLHIPNLRIAGPGADGAGLDYDVFIGTISMDVNVDEMGLPIFADDEFIEVEKLSLARLLVDDSEGIEVLKDAASSSISSAEMWNNCDASASD